MLSLLLAISLLVSAAAVALAVFSFNSVVSPAFNSPNQLSQTGSLERNLTELMYNVITIDNNLNMWREQLNHNLTLFILECLLHGYMHNKYNSHTDVQTLTNSMYTPCEYPL